METRLVIKTQLDDFKPQLFSADRNEWIVVSTDEEVEKFVKEHKVPEPLVRLIVDSLESLAERVKDDLKDVWARLDAMSDG